jgi:hypothetical protein
MTYISDALPAELRAGGAAALAYYIIRLIG